MEDHNEMLNDEGKLNKENKKELDRLQNQNERLLQDKESKEKEISELQKKLVGGSGGEDVLENLQEKLKEQTEKNDKLEADCYNLEGENDLLRGEKGKMDEEANETAKLREENDNLADRNEAKDEEIRELQRKLVGGTGGEEILQELQDKIKEAEENNRTLEKECKDLKNTSEELERKENESTKENKKLAKEVERIKKENDYLERESQDKGDEISKLQEQLLDGTGGDEILQELRDKVKDVEEKNKEMRKKCSEMEDHNEMLNDEGKLNKENEVELNEARNNVIAFENKEKDDDRMRLQREMNETSKLKNEKEVLATENKDKCDEVCEKQAEKLVEGTEVEDIFQQLQDEFKNLEEKNKELGEQFENTNKLLNEDDKRLKTEITEVILQEQHKELERTPSDLQNSEETAEQSEGETEKMREMNRLRKTMDRLERENKDQGDEIINLQKRLMGGREGENVLGELQEQLNNSKDQNNSLQAFCQDLEDIIETLKSEDGEKEGGSKERRKTMSAPKKDREIAKLRKNMRALEEAKKCQEEEIFELQKKLVVGEEIVKKRQERSSPKKKGSSGDEVPDKKGKENNIV